MERNFVRREISTITVIFQELAASNRTENMCINLLASTQQRRCSCAVGRTKKIDPRSRVNTGLGYYHESGDTNTRKEERPEQAMDIQGRRSCALLLLFVILSP